MYSKAIKNFNYKFKITLLLLLLLLNIISEVSDILFFKLEIYVTFICKPAHLIKRAYTMCMRTIKYSNEV